MSKGNVYDTRYIRIRNVQYIYKYVLYVPVPRTRNSSLHSFTALVVKREGNGGFSGLEVETVSMLGHRARCRHLAWWNLPKTDKALPNKGGEQVLNQPIMCSRVNQAI